MKKEKLFRALGDIGADLIEKAEFRTFAPGIWRRWAALAASLALVLSLGVLALPYFPMGCGSSDTMAPEHASKSESEAPESVEDESESPAELPDMEEEAVEEESTPEDNDAAPEDGAPYRTLTVAGKRYAVLPWPELELMESDIGEALGQVEAADAEEWLGCTAYVFVGEADRILVELPDGWLLCGPVLE